MKKVMGLRFFLVTSIALGLSACDGAKDIEYYRKNPDEAEKKLEVCAKTNDASAECKAAYGAAWESIMQGLQPLKEKITE